MSFLIDMIMSSLIEVFVYLMIELVGYYVARFVLPKLSSGKIIVHPLASRERLGFNWLGYRHNSGGRIEIEPAAAGFIGFLILLAALIAGLLLIRAST